MSDCQFANYGWFSAKQFKNFSCLTETEARNMNRLLNCFVEGGELKIFPTKESTELEMKKGGEKLERNQI